MVLKENHKDQTKYLRVWLGLRVQVLTLANNERIALTPEMKLLFEIHSLREATPATVSRAGILYINPEDFGWNTFVTSWVDKRDNQQEKANLSLLFDKFVPKLVTKKVPLNFD